MHNELLSICIPTYNRCDFLKLNIETILPIISKNNIAIFVSDNASTDKTSEYISDLQKKYEHIVYSCNETNIGGDRNFQKALQISDTKYRWLLGDDDTFIAQDFDTFLNLLQEDFDLIMVNAKMYNSPKETKVITDMNYFLANYGGLATYISVLIFSKQFVDNFEFEKFETDKSGLGFTHIATIFNTLALESKKVCYYSDVLVFALPGQFCSWNDKVFQYFIIDLPYVINLLPSYYLQKNKNSAIRSLCTVCWGVNGWLMLLYECKKSQTFTFTLFFKHLKNVKIALPFCGVIGACIVAFLPVFFLEILINLRKFLKQLFIG